MSALLENSQQYYSPKVEEEEEPSTHGEMFAIAFISFNVAFFLILSSWSAVLLISDNRSDGGPVGFLFHLIRAVAIG